ncbi:MAG TPA: polysaccharide biosynthesis protein, partial [Flavobacteriaceae bacterium]|nr:polysaccharide biosynthesis protein [Flavobacteriaceae bacterium]
VNRYFISASKVSHLLLEIGAFYHLDQKYLLSMGKSIFIKELAKQFISSKQYQYLNRLSISYSSLIAGEKLQESLLADDEELIDSNHPEVQIIASSSTETLFSESKLNIMLNSYETMNPIALKQCLFSLLKR